MTLTQYENGTAILEGAVIDSEDGSRGLDIHLYFEAARPVTSGTVVSRTTTVGREHR